MTALAQRRRAASVPSRHPDVRGRREERGQDRPGTGNQDHQCEESGQDRHRRPCNLLQHSSRVWDVVRGDACALRHRRFPQLAPQAAGLQVERFTEVLEAERPPAIPAGHVGDSRAEYSATRGGPVCPAPVRRAAPHVVDRSLQHRRHQSSFRLGSAVDPDGVSTGALRRRAGPRVVRSGIGRTTKLHVRPGADRGRAHADARGSRWADQHLSVIRVARQPAARAAASISGAPSLGSP
jgi:hypothetical protein